MTKDEYVVLRDDRASRFIGVVNALEAAGRDGLRMLLDLQDADLKVSAAWRELSHDDRMAILETERAQRERLLAAPSPEPVAQ